MNPGYFRFAAIANDTIVAVCEDDLWSVPVDGGVARRLTTGPGRAETPRLSPDGTQLAFVSRAEGSPEIFLMPAAGGPATRITFLGSEACTVSGWSPDGAYLYFTSDAASPFLRETQAYRIPAAGGHPEPLGLGHVKTLSVRADGRLVLGRNNDDPARWKRYRGGTAGDLWVQTDDGTYRRLISLDGNLVWPMWIGSRIAFLSDHEGIANIYSVEADGTGLTRHTSETEYFARFPSTDGKRIVYTAGADVRLLDLASGSVRTIAIEAPSTASQAVRRFISAAEDLEDFDGSPDGTAVVFVSRGRVLAMPLWEEAVVEHGSGNRVRRRCAKWLPDSKRIVCVSDEGGSEHLEIHDARRDDEPVAIAIDGDLGRIVELAVSPSAELVAIANHRYELLLVDLDGKRVRTIDRSPAGHIVDIAFSPDGRWIAYGYSPVSGASQIRIAKVKSGAIHDATSLLRTDRAPAWDPEGKYLYFIGDRDFNPVYDALQFDLSFPQASRPYAIALRPDVPSPFVAVPAPLHKDRRAEDDEERRRDEKPVRIDIDFDGIAGRLIGFPVEEGNYGEIAAVRGRAYYTKFPVRGIKPGARGWDDEDDAGSLLAYDFEQNRSATIAGSVHELRLAADRRTLIYSSADKLRAIDALAELPHEDDGGDAKESGDPGRRSGWLDLSRASVEVEPRDEWAQMFAEAWRLQKEQFWDETMSGVDWDLARERYGKLLPRVRTRAELSDLLWELHGELGTSHAYEIGGDHPVPPRYNRGFLGADLAWNPDTAGYTVVKRYRGDSWDREHDSPLAEPGQEVAEGETIVAINGRELSESVSPGALLVNTAGREVVLTVASKRGRRRAIVKTLRDERMLRYRAWVDANRAFVHERTGGTVGYLHIPDMGPWGFAEFHRGYLSEFNREGLIVDVRFNRGGHVSPLLLEKLARKRVGYDVSRYGPPIPYPPESVGGPMVALTNQFAGSDGDIFSHCFKLYKLGPLVGKRTWGGVIGINPYHRLVDGTITTQPEYSFWFVDVGWKVENYGTDPDYDVDIAPHDAKAGRDPQMERGLELIGQLRAAHPNGKPHFEPRPRLEIPTALAHAE